MQTIYRAMRGSDAGETALINHSSVAGWEHTYWDHLVQYQVLWGGSYGGEDGNDAIIRDRVGTYRTNPFDPGNAYISGGSGTDLISYAHYVGGVKIDLSTNGSTGKAEANGISGVNILGFDRLHSIENATGGQGGDLITGSNGVNVLSGGNGEDEIRAEGGNDTIHGGEHDDRLYGDTGNDSIKGGNGDDLAYGGADNDIVKGEAGGDILFGDIGNDNLYGGTGFNVLWGGTGNDILLIEGSGRADGQAGDDFVFGGQSSDTLNGGTENDVLNGLGGYDKLYGGTGNDTMDGGEGNDYLVGDTGLDQIQGGGGNDFIIGGANSDVLRGGAGIDMAVWEGSARVEITLSPLSGIGTAVQSGFTDSLFGIENFRTGSGWDRIQTGAAANTIDSGGNNDWVYAGGGNDAVLLGEGNDYGNGELGNDAIQGGAGDDILVGEGGSDVLAGGTGKDRLRSGGGADVLFGGEDADGFVFKSGEVGVDLIQDFELGEDYIDFDGFLADEPGMGESYLGKVYAVTVDNGLSSLLVGMTDDGWQAFAKLAGYVDVASVNAAIADGSLFHPTPLNGEAPDGLWL